LEKALRSAGISRAPIVLEPWMPKRGGPAAATAWPGSAGLGSQASPVQITADASSSMGAVLKLGTVTRSFGPSRSTLSA
jgi:hypothetical protein